MKTVCTVAFACLLSAAFAQKAKQKPIKLPAKEKDYKISMEYPSDVLYFTSDDLILFFEKRDMENKNKAHAENIMYLKSFRKSIELKKSDTTFQNSAERNLHKSILEIAPEMLAEARACDMFRHTRTMVSAVFVTPCEGNKEKFLITETDKKKRVIFGCD